MKLLIGNTSQISNYFPNDFFKISSRNISNDIFDHTYQEVHLTFGVNYKGLNQSQYDDINYYYTFEIIKNLLNKSEKIVVYSTCELWSGCWGGIDLSTPLNFHEEPYILSKWKLHEKLKSLNSKKVLIVYPFNFNSGYRNENYLFGKIFKSIKNKSNIEIGDTHFYRDLLHTSYVANLCQNLTSDIIIGSGRMFHVNDFIKDLYLKNNLTYEKYVTENITTHNYIPKNEYYLKGVNQYTYEMLLNDTLIDIRK